MGYIRALLKGLWTKSNPYGSRIPGPCLVFQGGQQYLAWDKEAGKSVVLQVHYVADSGRLYFAWHSWHHAAAMPDQLHERFDVVARVAAGPVPYHVEEGELVNVI